MVTELPDYIDPRRLAEQGRVLQGSVPAHELSRVPEPYRAEAIVRVDLQFGLDGGRIRVRGSIKTELEAICQRCLGRVQIRVAPRIDSLIITKQAAAGLADDEKRDFLIGGDEPLRLISYVEDEILLAAPMVPMHADGACEAPGGSAVTEPVKRKRPFADLAELLKGEDAK